MIVDITLGEEFIRDYDIAPRIVKKSMDKLISLISQSGTLPNSMEAHKAKGLFNELWIGYVTRTGSHWRVIFSMNEGLVTLHRLFDHDEMDVYLKL